MVLMLCERYSYLGQEAAGRDWVVAIQGGPGPQQALTLGRGCRQVWGLGQGLAQAQVPAMPFQSSVSCTVAAPTASALPSQLRRRPQQAIDD